MGWFGDYRTVSKYGRNEVEFVPKPFRIAGTVVVLLFGLFAALNLLFGSWFIVDAGERAVVLRLGAVNRVAEPGLNFKLPFMESRQVVDVRVAKHVTNSEASSKDLQIVHTEIALNYAPDVSKVGVLYETVGMDYEVRIIEPAINEVFKEVTARYTAEELVTKRNEVSHHITETLRTKLAPYWLTVAGINITDFDFSAEFNKAIEEKVTAEQRALKAARDLDRVKLEADQAVATAEGQARALRAQRLEVTPELLRLREVENQRLAYEKWNGVLPTMMTGAVPFIDVGKVAR